MAWDTINAILGLATVDPAFCHDLLENPLSAALAQHFDLTPEEQEVLKKIRAAASGNTFLCRHAREILDLSMSRSSPHLTERETQVLSLLRYGESNFRMACRLGLREKTVEKYLTHIYRKLNVNSRVEAILYAKELCI